MARFSGRRQPRRAIVLRGYHGDTPPGVTFDAVGPSSAGAGQAGTATPFTWQHICSGANRVLLVGVVVSGADGTVSTTATYNGVACASIAKRYSNDGTAGYAELFALAGPAIGTNTVSVAVTGSAWLGLECGSVSFNGADQTTPVAHSASAAGNSASASVAVASAVGNMTCDLVCCGQSIGASNQTSRWLLNRSGESAAGNGAQATAAGAASVTMTRTVPSDWWAIIAADIQAAAAAAAAVPLPVISPYTGVF